jgi:hypothetical protein
MAAAAVLGLVFLLLVSISAAQNSTSPAAKPTPRTAWGTPDLNGFYYSRTGPGVAFYGKNEVGDAGLTVKTEDGSIFYNHVSPGEIGIRRESSVAEGSVETDPFPPYKPEWLEKAKATAKRSQGNMNLDDPALQCQPFGVPRGESNMSLGLEIIQTRDRIALLYEDTPGGQWRLIYTDGRQHPEDFDSSHFGHSVGRWEGATLVVDVVGITEDTMLTDVARSGPYTGMLTLHSDQLHVIERWTRKGDELIYEATVEDPVALTKPWKMRPISTSIAAKGDYIKPQWCTTLDTKHLIIPELGLTGEQH